MNKIKISPKGFTLIELLVVVLIIGILTAVALPGYRKVVEKSRAADALTTMQAVAKSEHGWYLEHSNYTKDFANLDIELTDSNGNKADNASFSNALYTYELLDTGIIADRNNGEYSLYKDYESSQILCTPGTHYICEDLGAFTKVPCEKVGMAWANSNSTCYASDEDRCKDLYNNNMWHPDQQNSANSYCGYVNSWKPTINEGMVCIATGRDGNCGYLTVNSGGKCIAKSTSGCNGNETGEEGVFTGGDCVADGYASCKAIKITNGTCYANAHSSCSSIVINSGASCVGKGEWSCKSITVNSGGKCVTEVDTTCEGIYNGTGCCEGKYCPSNSPKCDCDIDPNTGKHLTSC